jgi:hypothetical protein
MRSRLVLLFALFVDPLDVMGSFPGPDHGICQQKIGIFRHRWQVTVSLDRDTLTTEQMEWLLLKLDGSIIKAQFVTKTVGLCGNVFGEPFTMTITK